MFKVVSRRDDKTIRTVYAVHREILTLFLIFEAGKWMWVDAGLYKPLED